MSECTTQGSCFFEDSRTATTTPTLLLPFLYMPCTQTHIHTLTYKLLFAEKKKPSVWILHKAVAARLVDRRKEENRRRRGAAAAGAGQAKEISAAHMFQLTFFTRNATTTTTVHAVAPNKMSFSLFLPNKENREPDQKKNSFAIISPIRRLLMPSPVLVQEEKRVKKA